MSAYDKNFAKDAYDAPLEGVIFNWAETGTEGPVRSFQDARHISPNGQDWSYDGLNPLAKGDILTIFNDASKKDILWRGHVDFDPEYRFFQQGVDVKTWNQWFQDQKPAVLQKRRANP